jgi:hypothetical protein
VGRLGPPPIRRRTNGQHAVFSAAAVVARQGTASTYPLIKFIIICVVVALLFVGTIALLHG